MDYRQASHLQGVARLHRITLLLLALLGFEASFCLLQFLGIHNLQSRRRSDGNRKKMLAWGWEQKPFVHVPFYDYKCLASMKKADLAVCLVACLQALAVTMLNYCTPSSKFFLC